MSHYLEHPSTHGYPTPPASPEQVHPSANRASTTPSPMEQPVLQNHIGHSPYATLIPKPAPARPEDRLGMCVDGRYLLYSVLGNGAYGVVYSALDVGTGGQVAVKCLSKFRPDGTRLSSRQLEIQRREILLHHRVSQHPNVISLLHVIDYADCTYVVLEFCSDGDLFHNITVKGRYIGRDELSRQVFLQLLDAVAACHLNGIFHRDLKPENILVSDNGHTVKLADFGLATEDALSQDFGCGSTFYMSPECLQHGARQSCYQSAPNDVWSLGVVLVNLTCGRNPWKQASPDDTTYSAFCRQPNYLQTILPVSDQLNAILCAIFDPQPDTRIGLADLRQKILACTQFNTAATYTMADIRPDVPPPIIAAFPNLDPGSAPTEPVTLPTHNHHHPHEANVGAELSDDDDAQIALSPSLIQAALAESTLIEISDMQRQVQCLPAAVPTPAKSPLPAALPEQPLALGEYAICAQQQQITAPTASTDMLEAHLQTPSPDAPASWQHLPWMQMTIPRSVVEPLTSPPPSAAPTPALATGPSVLAPCPPWLTPWPTSLNLADHTSLSLINQSRRQFYGQQCAKQIVASASHPVDDSFSLARLDFLHEAISTVR